MSRWPPDAGARLKSAALTLFAERGFAQVKAAEIAAAAGLTERSFFRHFRAKEDVLFEDYSGLDEGLTAAIADAPAGADPRALMQTAADFLATRLGPDRAPHRVLARVVASHPTLRARSALRDVEISAAMAKGLAHRGLPPPRAALIAAATAATCRLAYEEWLRDEGPVTLGEKFAALAEGLAGELGGKA